MIRAWLAARRTRRETVILALLAYHPDGLNAWQLARLAGRSVVSLYADLDRLETAGRIHAWWADGPHPRRRLYAAT